MSKRPSFVYESTDEVVISLLEMEESAAIQMLPAVTTVTFFEGTEETSTAVATDFLKGRVNEIVRRNKWLSCRLSKRSGRLVMVHAKMPDDDQPVATNSHFVVNHTINMNNEMPLGKIATAVKPIDLKFGSAAVDSKEDAPQFMVTLIPDARRPKHSFALVVSLSHTLGDGDTYYKILSMLSKTATLVTLKATRVADYTERSIASLGRVEENYTRSGGYMCGFMCAIFRGCCCCCRPKATPQLFMIDEQFITQEKQKYLAEEKARKGSGANEGEPYISTNDILSSWFFTISNADVGLIALSLRGERRQCGVTGEDAGNYENLLTLRPNDYATPKLVREAVNGMRRAGGGKLPLGRLEQLSAHIAVLSNWSTFFNGLDLLGEDCPGLKQKLHIPMLAAPPINIDFSAGCIFRPVPGKLAFWVLAPGFDAAKEKAGRRRDEGGSCSPIGELLQL